MITHFIGKSVKDFIKLNLLPRQRHRLRNDELADPEARLDAAVSWLMRSIDVCGGKASSKGLRLLNGWMPPYPETSGYIIPTLLTLAREKPNGAEFVTRAEQIANWLVGIQLPNGGIRARELGVLDDPDVFDTGMVLLGFNSLIFERGDSSIRDAAQRAAQFLVSAMDETGCFVRHLSHGMVHAYNVRAAWALVSFGLLTEQTGFVEAGVANARWTIEQQNRLGYYANNTFKSGGNANLHGIAYVMQGLLKIHDLTANQACLDSVSLAARSLLGLYQTHNWIAAEIGPDLQFFSRHICLTGYAQLAIVFFRLFQVTGEESYRSTAESLLNDVAKTQELESHDAPQRGAIAGSFPIYGRYAPLQYPNWATKFFVDALIAKKQVDRGHRGHSVQMYGG